MFRRIAFGVGLTLCIAPDGVANGWASGQNFVPAVQEAVAFDDAGGTLTVERGTPIYIHPNHAELETWLRWNERPSERRVQLDRAALPATLEGFRAYQRGDFEDSADLLESEARTESDAMVQTWKFILAGHSTLLADPSAGDKAVKRYRAATDVQDNPFHAHAHYFVFRALLHAEHLREAREALVALQEAIGGDGFEWIVLYSTYPQQSPLTAWRPSTQDIAVGINVLDRFIEARDRYRATDQSASQELQAKHTYDFAVATEALWQMYPDWFFDMPRPREAIRLLEETFERYPNTEAAARAFYRHMNYRRVHDGSDAERNEELIQLMREFLERFPDATLAPEARERLNAAERAARAED